MRGSSVVFGLVLILVLALASQSLAVPLTFTIDDQLSFASMSLETTEGATFSSAQTPGSDTTSLSGTAEIDVTGASLQFLTTSDTQFALQAVDQAPLPGGNPGTAPAQFGLSAEIPATLSGVVAARQYLADATSGVIPLVGTSFDSTQVTLDLTIGITDYNLTVLGNPVSGSIDTNFPALNELPGGTLTLAGDVYTLEMPFRVSGPINVSGVTVVTVYSGEIVATALIPEPAGIVLALIALAAFVPFLRRHAWHHSR